MRRLSAQPPSRHDAAVSSLAHYTRLGFTTSEYTCDSAAGGSPPTAYLYVDDADALAAEWRETGADVRSPEDTPWGRRDGVMIDPDANVIRFGSPL